MKNPLKNVSKKKKTLIIIGGIVVICIIVSFIKPKSDASQGVLVSAGTVSRGNLSQTISIKSTVEGSDSANVFSAANYRINSVTVKEGDVVQEGQILARLDADDLTDEYNKAKISYDEAKRNYDNSKTLYEEGALSQSDYLEAKAAYDTSALTLSSFNITENANVTSPIAGTVTRVNATVGKLANGGSGGSSEPLFVIENLDNLQKKVKVSEYDIGKIKVGQSATITAEVLGDVSVTGVVSHISPTGEARDAGGSEMVIPVVIDIDKGESNLIAGVTAKATILIDEVADVLTVPIDAVFEDPSTGETSVFIISENDTLTKVPVNIGLEGDFDTEISAADESGSALLTEGARIVLAPSYELADGMAVTVM